MKTFSKLEAKLYAIRRRKVTSSNLASYGYSLRDKKLEVRFKSGAIYEYDNVPRHIWNSLKAASSHGSFFYWNIRTSFPYRRLK